MDNGDCGDGLVVAGVVEPGVILIALTSSGGGGGGDRMVDFCVKGR